MTVQEIMDWCDNQCWRFPWARDVFVAVAKERIAEITAAKNGAPIGEMR